ncbi:hypothetical protein ANN_08750 [Periplaneta americana]|uniref:HAT C-terminal dimerisation domain-containing protein n=1 Tax=Periplaneta americana TaxID=6978 RepID=A0ABQ8T2B5_PERAM|nr:hypothetical protein ANN_08750 [Periplaneta americana]
MAHFNKRENFPNDLLNRVQNIYGSVFNVSKLQNELHVWYASNEGTDKMPIQIVNYLLDMNLMSGFTEIYKLALLVSTIPCTTSSVERSFSSLKRIHTYCRSTQTHNRMTNLSLISIEKELLASLREDKSRFYEAVIKKFLQKERRVDIEFK